MIAEVASPSNKRGEGKPIKSLTLWTAVGRNNPANHIAEKYFPKSTYIIKWYVGLEPNKPGIADRKASNKFQKRFRSVIESLGRDAIYDENITSNTRHLYGYFANYDSFEQAVWQVVGKMELRVERFGGETTIKKAEDLLEEGRIAFKENQKVFPAAAARLTA